MASMVAINACGEQGPPYPSPEPSLSSAVCDDLIGEGLPQAADPNGVLIGNGDTFFMGGRGRQWGENVTQYDGAFHMKVGIYTFDTRRPTVSVGRTDGVSTGMAEFTRDEMERHPGPIPVLLTFPTEGCWKVEAKGTNGFASIEVHILGALQR